MSSNFFNMIKKIIVKKKKRASVLREYNGGLWTKSQYFQKIRAILRNGFRYYKPIQDALVLASRPSQSLNKRIKKEYQCNHCYNWFKRLDVEIDHVEECGKLNCYEDIVPFIKRLTREEIIAYQILCKSCHKIKTENYSKLNLYNKNE